MHESTLLHLLIEITNLFFDEITYNSSPNTSLHDTQQVEREREAKREELEREGRLERPWLGFANCKSAIRPRFILLASTTLQTSSLSQWTKILLNLLRKSLSRQSHLHPLADSYLGAKLNQSTTINVWLPLRLLDCVNKCFSPNIKLEKLDKLTNRDKDLVHITLALTCIGGFLRRSTRLIVQLPIPRGLLLSLDMHGKDMSSILSWHGWMSFLTGYNTRHHVLLGFKESPWLL